jgi:hypothetical protein
MENLPSISDMTLGDILFANVLSPLWPLVIARPLKLFPKTLGLTPGVEGVPSREYMVRVLSDYPTHQAMLRALTGDHFASFVNHVRGKHRISPTTLKAIAGRFGPNVGPNEIAAMVHGSSKGPLLPALLSLCGLFEAVPNLFFAKVVKAGIPCPHCGGNLIDDRDVWWTKQPLTLPKPTHDLVERMLGAILVGTGFYAYFKNVDREAFLDHIVQLAEPSKHPFGNWIENVKQSRGAASYFDLCAASADGTLLPFDENRLSKWASGGELLPLALGGRLIAGLPDAPALELDLYAARAIAFVLDLVIAATPGATAPKRKTAQDMIFRRLRTLHDHAILFIRAAQKKAQERATGQPVVS